VLSRRVLLVIVCAVQFIDAYDVAAMGPALPRIQRELGMSPDALQWVVTAYVLGYGGFLLLGGRLADVVNRKRLFIGSVVVFATVSAVGGAATAGWVLIAARLAKGIAAAFSGPVSLAILLHVHEDEPARNRALGMYLSMAAVGFTSGLVLGGLLATVTWRLVLLIPAGLALLAAAGAACILPTDQPRPRQGRESVDWLGAVVITAGLMVLVYGVSRASATSWGDDITVASLVASLLLLAVFVWMQRTRRVPLVRLEIFATPGLSAANIFLFLLQGGYVGWQFIATLFLQNVEHWSPIAVGLVFVPNSLVALATARRWSGLVGRIGPWPIASAGILLVLAGYVWTLQLGNLDNLLVFALASLVMGVGYTMSYTAANIAAVAGVRPEERGIASGLFIASFQVGSGAILGVVASVFTAQVTHTGVDAYRWAITAAAVTAVLAVLVSTSGMIWHARRVRTDARRRHGCDADVGRADRQCAGAADDA
jgi:MFS family permease